MPNMAWYAQFPKDLYNAKTYALLGSPPTDVLKIILSNRAPVVATDAIRSGISEIATGGGYTSGGVLPPTQTGTVSGTTFTMAAGDPPVWTKAGSFPTFQYVILYRVGGTPVDPVIGYWDRGSALTMATDGDTFAVDLGANLWVSTFA